MKAKSTTRKGRSARPRPETSGPALASPELSALLQALGRNPRAFRLTNLETQTTWAFTQRDGKLVPVREVCPK